MAGVPDARAKRLAGICSPLGLAGAIAGLAAVALAEPLALGTTSSVDAIAARVVALGFIVIGVRGSTALLIGPIERPLGVLALLSAIGGGVVSAVWPGPIGVLALLGATPLLQGAAYLFGRRTTVLGVSGALIGASALAAYVAGNAGMSRMLAAAALIWMIAVNAHALMRSLERIERVTAPSLAPPAPPLASAPEAAAAVSHSSTGHSLIQSLRQFALLLAVGFLGWAIGSIYPMPHPGPGEIAPSDTAPSDAAKSAPTTAPAATAPSPSAANIAGFEQTLSICPQMHISNQPEADTSLRVLRYTPVVTVNGVAIASYPSRGACLSSGFGQRGAERHSGVDYHGAIGDPILAAGDGVILELLYRDDFGNMILIDHGGGVYTRYAHMNAFAPGLAAGAHVRAGQVIGGMGRTGAAQAVHLHYEVLTGDYANPRASFGLTPRDPLAPGA